MMKASAIMTPEPVTVAPGASLDHAMDLMDEHDIRHLPVLEEGNLVGVISDRDLLEATGWLPPRHRDLLEAPGGNVGSFMVLQPATTTPEGSLDDVLGALVQQRIGCLPVISDASMVGIVTEMNILRAYTDACRTDRLGPEQDEPAEACMTCDPRTVDDDVSGDEAAAIMREADIRHLPVLAGGKVVGMISDRDIRTARGRGELEVTLVKEFMGPNLVSVEPTMRLSSVALILAAEKISAVPVVTDGRLVGLMSLVDVMLACAKSLRRLS